MMKKSIPLNNRSVVALKGADAPSFLNGLVTKDVHTLQDIQFAALLSPQGRFLHDFFIIRENETLYLTPEKDRLDDFIKRLTLYKLRSNVTIEVVDLHLWWSTEPPEHKHLKDPRHPQMGFLWISTDHTKDALDSYDDHRIPLGIPDGSRDLVVDKAIILEHNYNEMGALDWNKGCYLGQELMARTHHRGLVRKGLFPVTGKGTLPASGIPLFLDGKKVGVMKSSHKEKGLALLYKDSVEKGHPTFESEGGSSLTLLPI